MNTQASGKPHAGMQTSDIAITDPRILSSRYVAELHLNLKLMFPLILLIVMFIQPVIVNGQTNRYVAPDGQGSDSGNCSSTGNPCASIQYAIGLAAADDIIWLQEGIHTGAITINKNLTIKGIRKGNEWDLRAIIQAHQDFGAANSVTVTISGGDTHAVMDHVLIRHGVGTLGGGINVSGRLTLTDSGIIYNKGSGIFNTNAAHTYLDNVYIAQNEASFGGGIRSGGGSHTVLVVQNSTIEQNTTTGHGGGIYSGSGLVTIENSIIKKNSAVRDGGGIYYADGIHNMAVKDSEISNNVAGGNGGGIRVNNGTLHLDNSVVKNNTAKVEVNTSTPFNGGGGLYLRGPVTRYTITNSSILDNETTESGGGIYILQTSTSGSLPAQIRNTEISGNKAEDNGGGVVVADRALVFIGEGSAIANNMAGSNGGGIWTDHILEIQDTRISGNTADLAAAVYIDNSPVATINRARITGNTSRTFGTIGVINSTLTLSNSLISGNKMLESGGAGFAGIGGKIDVVNTTIASNHGTRAPVIISSPSPVTTLTNVIIWGNGEDSEQIRHGGLSGVMTIQSSIIEGGLTPETVVLLFPDNFELIDAGGNMSGDPELAAPLPASSAPTTGGVYRVMPDGAAVNAGLNEAVTSLHDLLGNARITGGIVDIGAYEYIDDESYTEFEIPENNRDYTFRDWMLGLRFTGIQLNNPVYLFVEEHDDEPEEPAFISPEPVKISRKRWVVTTTGGDFQEATISIRNASKLIDTEEPEPEPERLVIYRREKKGIGLFEPLQTTYNGLDDVVSAKISSFSEFIVGLTAETVSIREESTDEIPAMVQLEQNYPNPFNPETRISFGLPEAGPVRLEVFDLTGRRVAVLADAEMPAGMHTLRFNAAGLASGFYIARLTAGGTVQHRKMLLVR